MLFKLFDKSYFAAAGFTYLPINYP